MCNRIHVFEKPNLRIAARREEVEADEKIGAKKVQ
jgi:hypothetical protein